MANVTGTAVSAAFVEIVVAAIAATAASRPDQPYRLMCNSSSSLSGLNVTFNAEAAELAATVSR